MQINIYQVDAFSEIAFGGNPAGVVISEHIVSEQLMKNIAKEMNLSETAFVTEMDGDLFNLKFFTPTCEVDLCGHATIATFYTLATMGYIDDMENGTKRVYQNTNVGKLSVDIIFKNNKVDYVLMEQAKPQKIEKSDYIQELVVAMGISKNDIGILDLEVDPEIISTGLIDIILPLRTKEILDNLNVDMELLSKLSEKLGVVGVHAFCLPELNSEEVYTRNFAPYVGIPEEAATGTSNGALIYFLKKNGLINTNKIIANQGESLNRPSKIYCEIDNEYTVRVGGKAKIVINGIMDLD